MVRALMIALAFLLPAGTRVPVLRVVGSVGFVVVITANWRGAHRLGCARVVGTWSDTAVTNRPDAQSASR